MSISPGALRPPIDAHRAALADALRRFHEDHPLSIGSNRTSLRTGVLLALTERDYLALIEAEVAVGRLAATEGGRVRASGHVVTLSAAHAAYVHPNGGRAAITMLADCLKTRPGG